MYEEHRNNSRARPTTIRWIEKTPRVTVHAAFRAQRRRCAKLDELFGLVIERSRGMSRRAEPFDGIHEAGMAASQRLIVADRHLTAGRAPHGSLLVTH
jgi:hypothetical protein